MGKQNIETLFKRTFAAKGKQLLAIGWQGFQQEGIGAVLYTEDRPEIIYASARDLHKFSAPGPILDGLRHYCAVYDPQTAIVLCCFGANDIGAAVTVAADAKWTPRSAYDSVGVKVFGG